MILQAQPSIPTSSRGSPTFLEGWQKIPFSGGGWHSSENTNNVNARNDSASAQRLRPLELSSNINSENAGAPGRTCCGNRDGDPRRGPSLTELPGQVTERYDTKTLGFKRWKAGT
ncbi:hypothetical protein BP6252_10657 [Coleophoma cylindrospora]|uniref:Uncharacterized protein n=1 Tax=Coleophoma cylindrospora TaxID=1849047 RepID=A0A3D8QT44_9HELO|nr:hypothetical protein BP6252_10657 [Coleophoma cylindrospora]